MPLLIFAATPPPLLLRYMLPRFSPLPLAPLARLIAAPDDTLCAAYDDEPLARARAAMLPPPYADFRHFAAISFRQKLPALIRQLMKRR